MGTKTYNAKEVTVSIAGRVIESGWADGDFVKIARVSDDWSDKSGADGEVARSKNNDNRCDVNLMLMQTSDGNSVMSQIRAADLAAPNGAGIGQFIMRDQFGSTIVRGQCWIVKPSDITRGREAGGTDWKLRVVATEYNVGGTASVGV